MTVNLNSYVGSSHTLKFNFHSDTSVTYEGAYLDNIVVTATQPDLTKKSDNLSNLSPCAGDTLTASITVTNQACSGASADAGAFHVGFYWSTSSSFPGVSPFYERAVSG